jgi:hypothetical protein
MTVMIATGEGIFKCSDGSLYRIERGRSTADAEHPLVKEFPNAWAPFAVHFGAPESSTVPADPERDEKLERLRAELAEVSEALDHYQDIYSTISVGLRERDLLKGVDVSAEGWLVAAIFAAVDQMRLPAPETPSEPAEVSREVVRQWAKSKGISVADSGRIAAAVIEQYRQAHAS